MNDALVARWRIGQQVMRRNPKHQGDTYWAIETKDVHYTSWVSTMNHPHQQELVQYKDYLVTQDLKTHECALQVLR